MGLSITWHL